MSVLIITAPAVARYALLLTTSYRRFKLHVVGLQWEAPRICAVVRRPACGAAMASRRLASATFLVSTLCVSAWAQTASTVGPPPAGAPPATANPPPAAPPAARAADHPGDRTA